jgi:hypothetical protein
MVAFLLIMHLVFVKMYIIPERSCFLFICVYSVLFFVDLFLPISDLFLTILGLMLIIIDSLHYHLQCSGSGSIESNSFWASWIRIR